MYDLHRAIQGVIGWQNSHLYSFFDGDIYYSYNPFDGLEDDMEDARKMKLRKKYNDRIGSFLEHENMLEWLGLESAAEFNPNVFNQLEMSDRMGFTIRENNSPSVVFPHIFIDKFEKQ